MTHASTDSTVQYRQCWDRYPIKIIHNETTFQRASSTASIVEFALQFRHWLNGQHMTDRSVQDVQRNVPQRLGHLSVGRGGRGPAYAAVVDTPANSGAVAQKTVVAAPCCIDFVYIYICTYMYEDIYMCVYVHIYIYMYLYVSIYICESIYI